MEFSDDSAMTPPDLRNNRSRTGLAVGSPREAWMTTERDAPTMLDKATEAVHDAKEAVQATTQSIAGAIEAGSRPGGFLDHLARLVRKAPLQSLAIAFLVGFMVARRR
jgi:hypothetical protein